MSLLLVTLLAVVGSSLSTSVPATDQSDQDLEAFLASLLSTELPSDCGHASYACVPYFQCQNDVINTDGSGLIDVRTRPSSSCKNKEYPDVPAVCCQIPGSEPTPPPVDVCPGNQECVDFQNCGSNDVIVTDGSGLINIRTGFTSCRLLSGKGGRCCRLPAPFIASCPGKSVCQAGPTCKGQALNAINEFQDYIADAKWTQCSYETYDDGVCCRPPPDLIYDVCPGDSVCVSPVECKGTALDNHNSFHDYVDSGSWARCTTYNQGVCCINPVVIPDLPTAGHCGFRNYHIDTRISSDYAKNEAAFGEFPWQAIIFYANYTYKCGASLISDRHLLTAAHCVNGLHPSDIRIRLGEYQVNDFNEPLPYVDKDVLQIYTHGLFNPKNLHYDIAVLELVEPVFFRYHINSVCLPKEQYVPDHHAPCFITGWGKNSFTGNYQHILKKVDVPFVHNKQCQNLLRKTRLGKYFKLDKTFVCAGGEDRKDACSGDGGGPLVCKDPITERYILTGITAWGIDCGQKNVPGVYVNVAYFTDWVDEVLKGGLQQAAGYGTN